MNRLRLVLWLIIGAAVLVCGIGLQEIVVSVLTAGYVQALHLGALPTAFLGVAYLFTEAA
jgi:hypothetical protein